MRLCRYPKMRVDAVILRGEFGPGAIETVNREFHVAKVGCAPNLTTFR